MDLTITPYQVGLLTGVLSVFVFLAVAAIALDQIGRRYERRQDRRRSELLAGRVVDEAERITREAADL